MAKESLFYRLIQWIGLIFIGHLIIVIGLIGGLGLFLTLPAFMTVFLLYRQVKDRTDFARLQVFPFIWQHMRYYGRNYAGLSVMWSIGLLVLVLNMYFLMTHWGLVGFGLTLLTMLLLGIWLSLGLIFAYLVANYPEVERRELYQNTVAYGVVRAIEIGLGNVLIFACLLAIENISIALLICTVFGIMSYGYHALCRLLLSGISINKLWQGWRRSE